MKILATADIHNRLDWFEWILRKGPQYDAVIIAGDLLDMFKPIYPQIQYLGGWVTLFAKVGVPLWLCDGNHDFNENPVSQLFGEAVTDADPLDDFAVQACQREHWMDQLSAQSPSCLVGGTTVVIPELSNLIVTSLPYHRDEDLTNQALLEEGAFLRRKSSPPPGWIVLHHVPPIGRLGRDEQASSEFRDWIEEYQPKVVFCGHDHKSPFKIGSCHERIGLTHVFNAGHNPENDYPCHVIVDTVTMKYQWNH